MYRKYKMDCDLPRKTSVTLQGGATLYPCNIRNGSSIANLSIDELYSLKDAANFMARNAYACYNGRYQHTLQCFGGFMDAGHAHYLKTVQDDLNACNHGEQEISDLIYDKVMDMYDKYRNIQKMDERRLLIMDLERRRDIADPYAPLARFRNLPDDLSDSEIENLYHAMVDGTL